MLTKLELTQGFAIFAGKIKSNRIIDPNLLTLTPPKNVMTQLLLNEREFSSQQELEYFRDDFLADMDRFQLCKLYLDSDTESIEE